MKDGVWSQDGPGWRTINRWLWIALPEDARQNVHLAFLLCGSHAKLQAVQQTFRFLMREMRRTMWDRKPCRKTSLPRALQPSRIKKRTGWINDRAAKSRVRMVMPPERRREIATMGNRARRANGER